MGNQTDFLLKNERKTLEIRSKRLSKNSSSIRKFPNNFFFLCQPSLNDRAIKYFRLINFLFRLRKVFCAQRILATKLWEKKSYIIRNSFFWGRILWHIMILIYISRFSLSFKWVFRCSCCQTQEMSQLLLGRGSLRVIWYNLTCSLR